MCRDLGKKHPAVVRLWESIWPEFTSINTRIRKAVRAALGPLRIRVVDCLARAEARWRARTGPGSVNFTLRVLTKPPLASICSWG